MPTDQKYRLGSAGPVDAKANSAEMFMQCGFGHTIFPLDYRSHAAIADDRAA
jgi:hypothetical protein